MPNIKSAKKRVKVTRVKSLSNQMAKSALKTTIKKFEEAASQKDAALAGPAYKSAVKAVDRAAAKGLIHKNTAARRKSAFTLLMNDLNQ